MGNFVERAPIDKKLFSLMEDVDEIIFSQVGDRVVTGPFKGMKWQNKARWVDGNNSMKLFGVYESELHGVVERAISRKPSTVYNIGCAEGYYAVGLALRTDVTTVAVDTDKTSLDICRENADANDIIEERLFCRSYFSKNLFPRDCTLLFLDCEGAEIDILDSGSNLAACDIIVECHDFLTAGITDELIRRFKDTHLIEKITPQPPKIDLFPNIPMSDIYRSILFTEKRPPNTCWLAMWRRGL